MALAFGIGGGLGTVTGGKITQHLVRKTSDQRWNTHLAALATVVALCLVFPVFMATVPWISFVFLLISMFFCHFFLGPVLATVQNLAGIHRRSQAAAYYLFLANLISMSIGPLAVGIISDYFNESVVALRNGILSVVAVSGIWAVLHFLMAAKSLNSDLKFALSDDISVMSE